MIALNPEDTIFMTVPPTSTSFYVSANKAIFLQTEQAEIYNHFDPQLLMTLHVILNSGSQRSYVNHKVKGMFDLKFEPFSSYPLQPLAPERRTVYARQSKLQ